MKKALAEMTLILIFFIVAVYAEFFWQDYKDMRYYEKYWPRIAERIGVDIIPEPSMPMEDRWSFTEPEPGSPAELAGIQEGDLLYEYTFNKFVREFWYGNDDGNAYFYIRRDADNDPETLKDGTRIKITMSYPYKY